MPTEIRGIGEVTRGEALTGISDQDRIQLLNTLTIMKTNLLEVCRLPVDGKEASHG